MEELQLENYHCRRRHQRNRDYQQHHLSGLTTREASPDSVILALDWHLSSLFSSSAASADRCSDASNTSLGRGQWRRWKHKRVDLFVMRGQHLAGSVRESWSGGPDPDPDPNKTGTTSVHHKQDSRFYSKQIVKAKVQKEDHDCDVEEKDEDQVDVEEEHNLSIYSARNSFSLALKECQERRSRSEALSRKSDWTRPGSVDFNDGIASSPTMGAVKAGSTGSRKSGTFPSPGTPNYRNPSIGLQKGWSSERVPPQSYAGMKNGGAAYLPFNRNGRTLPSKWEDAERWIFSPVSTDNFISPSVPQPTRRPKSKSGPLGPPGVAYYSLYSPALPLYEGGNMGNFIGRSPLCAEVMGAEGFRTSRSQGVSYQAKHCMGRSVSVHGYSDPLDNQTCTVPQDENLDKQKDAATDTSRCTISRRDMATQMNPHGSTCSSPKRTPSSCASPHDLQIVELSSVRSPKLEMKDVLVDEWVMTRRSQKSKYRIPEKSSENSDEWKTKDADVQSCVRDVLDPVKSISKVKREEVKITAWENLQKAKAEAAIRKLEMNLEKKRSSSMDKIMKKLRSAQKRAQEMRSSVVSNQDPRTSNNPHKALIFRRAGPVGSLCGCFTSHAF